MKKILTLLCAIPFLFASCSNDDDFVDTDTIGQTIDLTGVNFEDPDFAINFSFTANNIPVFNSDAVLVYRQEGINNGNPIWEPLPTASFFFFNDATGAVEGFLNYRYNFTLDDVDIILNFDLPSADLLTTEFTNNQVFRIVIVPAEFAENNTIDFSDFNAVSNALNLESKDIPIISLD